MEYLKVWTNFKELLEPLNDSERGRLFTVMLEYAETAKAPELKGNERYVWPSAKQSIDRTRQDSLNASKGGRKPNQTEANRTEPDGTEQNRIEPERTKANYKEKDKDNINKENPLKRVKESALRFTPPTVEAVASYCKERNNSVNAQTFVDFYASKGWKVGNNPMKDWKAAVRTWEQRDNGQAVQKPKLLRAQMYQQREYKEEEMRKILGVDDLYLTDEQYMERYGVHSPYVDREDNAG